MLKDEKLHVDASKGFKSTAATVDLWGSEDALIKKEARSFWCEETLDYYPTMRENINAELK